MFTLNLQIEDNLLQPKTVAGCTCVVPRILCFHCANHKAPVTMDTAPRVNHNRCWCCIAETKRAKMCFRQSLIRLLIVCLCTDISFSHLIVGDGSPTALHGSTMSLIHGVVTVLLKVKIRAGAAKDTIYVSHPVCTTPSEFTSSSFLQHLLQLRLSPGSSL